MYNWTVDTIHLRKDKKKFTIWKLEQMVNFGLNKKKLDKRLLLKYWDLLNLDQNKKRYLKGFQ